MLTLPRMGTLYYGDNLEILKRYIKDDSVDPEYLDPPFNSAQNYNAFFHEKDGTDAASQIHAFEDTWPPDGTGDVVDGKIALTIPTNQATHYAKRSNQD
jgi:adenine specific DNA methylase Mod